MGAPLSAPGTPGSQPVSGADLASTSADDIDPHRFVVAITFRALVTDQTDSICTGTIVGLNRVLTAGHCACGVLGTYRVFANDNGIPIHRRPTPDDYLTLDGPPILFDPWGCSREIAPGRDLALLKIYLAPGSPPYCGRFSCPIAAEHNFLDLREEIARAKSLTVVGFGFTESGSYGQRRTGSIKIFSADCLDVPAQWRCEPFEEMILSDLGRKIDSCGGDSGGPVFLRRGQNEVLVAIVSRGLPPSAVGSLDPCGGGGIYTLLGRDSVRRWLTASGVSMVRPILR
jgi:hypothetical protein